MAPRLPLRTARDRLTGALTVGAALEILWTIYLGWRLPRRYEANNWDLAWVGLDVAEVLMLLCAAWAAWKRRAALIPFAIASATLLMLDAWFDVTTAGHGDVLQSVIVAIVVEVPSSIVLLWIARRAARRLFHTHYSQSGLDSMPVLKVPISPIEDD